MKLLNSIYICIFTGTSWWSDDGAKRTRRRDSFSLLYIILICVCFIGVYSRCRPNVGLYYYVLFSLFFFVVFFLIFFFLSYLYSFMPFLIWPSFQIMRGGDINSLLANAGLLFGRRG